MDPGLSSSDDTTTPRTADAACAFHGPAAAAAADAKLAALPGSATGSCQQQQQQHATLGFLSALTSKSDVIRQFTPSWFCVNMGTGSVALSIMAFPYRFTGQDGIAMAVWALNVMLFIAFSVLMLSRALFFPRTLVSLWRHPNQSLFVGAIPMAFNTITNGVAVFLIPRHGVAASHVAHAFFWVNLPAVLLCIVLVPFSMIAVHDHALPTMTAVWLLPVLPAFVAGNTAGVVARSIPDEGLAMSITLVGLVLLSVGFLLSFQITTIYYNRLIVHSLPPREVIVSSFLPVGAMAMTALGLMDLAAAADLHLPAYVASLQPGVPVDAEWLDRVGDVMVGASGLLGLCIWGFSVWWLVLALSCIADTVRQGIPFSLGWWGAVFPFGTVAIAACQLAGVLRSQGLRYIGAFTVAAHIILWLVVVTLTAQRALLGQLFHAPCLQATTLAGAAAAAAAAAAAGGGGGSGGVAAAAAAAGGGGGGEGGGSTPEPSDQPSKATDRPPGVLSDDTEGAVCGDRQPASQHRWRPQWLWCSSSAQVMPQAGRPGSSLLSPALTLAELEVRLDSVVWVTRPNSSTIGATLEHHDAV